MMIPAFFVIAQESTRVAPESAAGASNTTLGFIIIGGVLVLIALVGYLFGKNRAIQRLARRCPRCDALYDHGRFCPKCGLERVDPMA